MIVQNDLMVWSPYSFVCKCKKCHEKCLYELRACLQQNVTEEVMKKKYEKKEKLFQFLREFHFFYCLIELFKGF